ncbi:unnamed protein product [Notodromas monacha]|uniref:ubiquitinyl hydrolase 1 n=1 Tax=Notodromas monacha TaxID=399045 RepID=A0A7R9BTS6_9CRUS|nr:unnamed protein product [Notodromas monacha]CAG0921609.1 unnamed protein product [Notodromas monacha]
MGPTLTFREYKGPEPLSPTVGGIKDHAEETGIPMSREPGLTYLFNGSNMCFINSVLQALAQIPGFVNQFLDDGVLNTMHRSTAHSADGRLTLGLGEVFKKMWLGRKKLINAGEFKALLTQAHSGYDNDDQQDAHEFFLDLMLSVLLSTRMFPFNEKKVRRFPAVRLADRRFRNALQSPKGVSPYADDFVGQLRVTYQCQQCFRLKHAYENFLTLELELPSKGTSRSLEHLFKDNISSPTFFPAMRCALPRVFVIQLRRYGRSPLNRSRFVKLFNYIDFPMTLNMLPFLKDATDGHFIYDLRGVVQHMGPDTDCGHYTTKLRYLYKTDEDDWRMVNDHIAIDSLDDPTAEINPKVRPSMRSTIFTPYILFYVARPHDGVKVDFIMPTVVRYAKEIKEGGMEYLKKLTDNAPRIRTSWSPGDPITEKHILYHADMCSLFPKIKPTPRRPTLPEIRQILPLDEECVEEVEWTDEEVLVGHREIGGQDPVQDDQGEENSEESDGEPLRLRGGGNGNNFETFEEDLRSEASRRMTAVRESHSESSTLSHMFNSSDSRGLAASKSQARHSVRSTALSNNARAANNSRCAATSWIECAAASVNDDEVQSWSRAIVDQVKRMDGLKDGDLMDNGLTQKEEREILRQKRFDAWQSYLNQVQHDCHRKEELEILQMLDVMTRKKGEPPMDMDYVWDSYQSSEKMLQERASALDELNRSIANKEIAVEKLANEEDWLREQQANYITPESQAKFLRYWMKQARKRGTQAVLDFKQSSLQRYLADRRQVIDTLVLIKRIDDNFSKRNRGFNWAIDALGAHLTNCKDPKRSFLFQKLFPTIKDGSLPHYPSVARYWDIVGKEARNFEQDLTVILKEVKAIVPALRALFPASDGGYDALGELVAGAEDDARKDLVFYPVKKGEPPMDMDYVWDSYQSSEKMLQERASALDELNRSIANKEIAVEKLANEEDWLREQQANYITPESQAKFLRYWMKQARKRGTQAVLDFKQSSLQRYLADRRQVIDTLVLIKRIDDNFSKRNRGFNWAIDALGAHLTNCKDPKRSFLFQKLFPTIKDGSLPHYPSVARYWDIVGKEARNFEQDLTVILKEVKAIVPALRALFPASDGGYDALGELVAGAEDDARKDLVFYPVLPIGQ